MGIGYRIKEARESLGLTQTELGNLVGVTGSAITNYEKETSHPKEQVIYKLMEHLNVDANYLFQDVIKPTVKEIQITPAERIYLNKYHNLDDYGKELVKTVLEKESERVKKFGKLSSPSAQLRIYTYMNKIASAGTGFYFDDIPTDTIEAPYKEGADFIIGVSGDSMEPTFFDGDLLYVSKQENVKIGDIGIFIVNNECFVKEVGENELISHNPNAKNIPGKENVICVGKVLGKVNN